MAYIALYRKFRPLSFSEVVGQENVVKILKHQIQNNQVGHAYLFCGGRGTGKTSMAKIFSRAVNCLSPIDGEPCNECAVCTGVINGSLVDVLEIDAASNNSVDNIRSIRDDVIYAPTLAKYKVYIIDEVHMLSTGAFNALLKTLEEPPEHVIFILATTEPHKLPITILSRCQRFEFKRISISDITKRLSYICDQNNISYDKSALDIISKVAEGALRDAISVLDQIITSGPSKITEEIVKDVIGMASTESTFAVLNSILNKDINSAIKTLSDVFVSGKDVKYFVWELISLTRDALIYKASNDRELIHNFSSINQIEQLAKYDTDKLTNIITTLSELENNIKWATFPNIMLEATIINLCNNENTQKVVVTQSAPAPTTSTPIQKAQPAPTTSIPETKPQNTAPTFSNWNEILNSLKSSGKVMLYGALVNSTAKIDGNIVTIVFNSNGAFGKSVVDKPENMEFLKTLLAPTCGGNVVIKSVLASESQNIASSSDNKCEEFLKSSDNPFTVI